MSKIETNVPNVYITDLERLAQKVRQVTGNENTEISFEFIIASLFPTSWNNIQNALNAQYTKGYIQGRLDKEQEMRRILGKDLDEDGDCYCE